MLYREITAVCSQIHTKHRNALCGQNVELLNVNLVVHIVTTGLLKVSGYNLSEYDSVYFDLHVSNFLLVSILPPSI